MSNFTESLSFTRTVRATLRPRKAARIKQAEERRKRLQERHPATVALRLALAHKLQTAIDRGDYDNQSDIARCHQLTPARITQLLNLLLLAPDIQEDVLALEFPVGREPVTERSLARIATRLHWHEQREAWSVVKKRLDAQRAAERAEIAALG